MSRTRTHSALKSPLNDILGSKGNIDVLRLLVNRTAPSNHSDLICSSNLSRQGVYDAVQRLIETGVVEYTGSGNKQLLKLREDHPLYNEISNLFKAERQRYEKLLKHLKTKLNQLQNKPDAAWIFGDVAKELDEYGDPIEIAILSNLKTVDDITERLKQHIRQVDLEKSYDVIIDLVPITLADLETRPALFENGIILLWGIHPKELFENKRNSDTEPSPLTHQELDNKSRLAASSWVELLRRHPDIITRTLEYLEEQIQETPSGVKREWQEWEHLLRTMSHQQLKKFLESNSQRAVRLRQSLPFWPVLTPQEHKEFDVLNNENGS